MLWLSFALHPTGVGGRLGVKVAGGPVARHGYLSQRRDGLGLVQGFRWLHMNVGVLLKLVDCTGATLHCQSKQRGLFTLL